MKMFIKVLAELATDVCEITIGDRNPLTRSGMRKFAASLDMDKVQFYETLRNLRRKGYVYADEQGRYKITPRGAKRLRLEDVERTDWQTGSWNGNWIVVVFDIPEKKRKNRDAFRSFLNRKGFFRLQDSVFVSPFADFDQLNFVRHEYCVEKFVNIFESKSASIDDDQKLRRHFAI